MFGLARTRVVSQPAVLRWLPLRMGEYRDVRDYIEERLPSLAAVRARINTLLHRGMANDAEVVMPSGNVVVVIADSMAKRGINQIV